MARSNAERQRAYRERKKAAGIVAPAPPAVKPKGKGPRGWVDPLVEEEIERYLATIASGYSGNKAAAELGRSPRTFTYWRARSPENEARYKEAYERGTQALEDEAVRRGMDGYEIITRNGKGEITKVVETYSDAVLQRLLAGRMPEKYREGYNQGGSQPTVIIVESSFRARRAKPIEVDAVEVRELGEGD